MIATAMDRGRQAFNAMGPPQIVAPISQNGSAHERPMKKSSETKSGSVDVLANMPGGITAGKTQHKKPMTTIATATVRVRSQMRDVMVRLECFLAMPS
jgi:NAD(P)H-hydrate repair Nnr-like enzyme with NAD(P)H-hydrate dehydratase domain